MPTAGRVGASCAAAVLLVGCSVQESTRAGGLIEPVDSPPSSSAPAESVSAEPAHTGSGQAEPAPTVMTVGASVTASADVPRLDEHASAADRDGQGPGRADEEPEPADAGAAAGAADGEAGDGDDPQSNLDSASSTSGQVEPSAPPQQPQPSAAQVLAAAEPPDGFGEGLLTVMGMTWPVIVADTPRARQQGLMGVTDFAALGGYAAMVFVFESDTTGAFWMRDTPLPLRITFATAEGTVVSGADMTPCLEPTPSQDCERYFPDGPYRIAIEHPLDPAFDLGLAAADRVELAPQ